MNINKRLIIKIIIAPLLVLFAFTTFPNLAFILIDLLTEIVQKRIELDLMITDFFRSFKA